MLKAITHRHQAQADAMDTSSRDEHTLVFDETLDPATLAQWGVDVLNP
jgi:hypothetical protein